MTSTTARSTIPTPTPTQDRSPTDNYLYFALGLCVALVLVLLVVFLVVLARRRRQDFTELMFGASLGMLGTQQHAREVKSNRYTDLMQMVGRCTNVNPHIQLAPPIQMAHRFGEADSGCGSSISNVPPLPNQQTHRAQALSLQSFKALIEPLAEAIEGHGRSARIIVPAVHVLRSARDLGDVEDYEPVGLKPLPGHSSQDQWLRNETVNDSIQPRFPVASTSVSADLLIPGHLSDGMYASAEELQLFRSKKTDAAKAPPMLSRTHTLSSSCNQIELYEDINNISNKPRESGANIETRRKAWSYFPAGGPDEIYQNMSFVDEKESMSAPIDTNESDMEEDAVYQNEVKMKGNGNISFDQFDQLYAKPDMTKKKSFASNAV